MKLHDYPLLIGIGYIVEQFRLESQLGLTKKEQIERLFIQTLVDSGIITLIYALLIPLRNGVSMGFSNHSIAILGDPFDPENIVISIAVFFREGCSNSLEAAHEKRPVTGDTRLVTVL